jgi:predicted peptidase
MKAGLHRQKLDLGDGATMRYSVSVPELEAGATAALVLALHYGGPVTPHYGEDYMKVLVLPGLDELQAVFVAPDCPGNGWADPVSEAALLALLDHAASAWPVDSERVVITGYSLGGGGTWSMIGRHPERFCAAIPMAGWPDVDHPADGAVPIYAIHGRDDEVISIKPTRTAIAALQARGKNAQLLVVDGPTHYSTHLFSDPLATAVGWLEKVCSGAPQH